MAEKATNKGTDAVTDMIARMSACNALKDLIDLAASKDFARTYNEATPEDQQVLRDHYDSLRAHLQFRVKLSDIKDEQVTVLSADVKDSRISKRDGSPGEVVILKGTRKSGQPFTVVTSAAQVLRHFKEHWNKLPALYVFGQVVIYPDDPNMSPMWEAKRVPTSDRARLPWDRT